MLRDILLDMRLGLITLSLALLLLLMHLVLFRFLPGRLDHVALPPFFNIELKTESSPTTSVSPAPMASAPVTTSTGPAPGTFHGPTGQPTIKGPTGPPPNF